MNVLARLTNLVALLVLLVTLAGGTEGQVPTFLLRCNPYTGPDGQTRNGAFGPCNNACFAVNRDAQPGLFTALAQGVSDRDAGCASVLPAVPRHRDTASRCCQGSSLFQRQDQGEIGLERTPLSTRGALARADRFGTTFSRVVVGGGRQYSAYGNSCDEYPLASTARGPKRYRTLRCVPLVEKQNRNGQWKTFRSANDVKGGVQVGLGVVWATERIKYTSLQFSDALYFEPAHAHAHAQSSEIVDIEPTSLDNDDDEGRGAGAMKHLVLSNGWIASVHRDSPIRGGDRMGRHFWIDGDDVHDLEVVSELSAPAVRSIYLAAQQRRQENK
ncbi:uncharacterized protein PSFLO_06401 [Pseudozyma flocculosa]|uniref:Deoxyribonuclease NucA/NucB domain-containing protein n=1 Tax=Pseudozyma flocculosa TaxID=84751 RepID=A0A5C3FBZ6_9BASI|nr:uncharacterized protein PSFLO_06401 [Pseudozyma flocculosa]